MARVAVQPDVLRWARERSGLAVEDLALRFPKLPEWELEESQPTLHQLEDYARKTMTPLGYFFLPEPPEETLPIPDFRTLADRTPLRPSPNLLDTVQAMQRRQDWMRETLVDEGHKPLEMVGVGKLGENVVETADQIRETLALPKGWAEKETRWEDALRRLRNAIEATGVLVVINGIVANNTHRKLNVAEFRGFVLADEYAPLIFVNGADAKSAQMFTLAHELAHVWIGESGVFNLVRLQPSADKIEKYCNAVAAEFLVPEDELRSAWPSVKAATDRFGRLARRFKVSALVAARRALDLGLIAKDAFFNFYDREMKDAASRAKIKRKGGDFWANQDVRVGMRFGSAVVRAAQEGRLLFRDAYALVGLSGASFEKYARSLGYGAASG